MGAEWWCGGSGSRVWLSGRAPWRWGWVLGCVVAAFGVVLAMSASARAADCSLADFDYNGACGPEYESPAWGDAAGWSDPSQYSTIQLADVTGNGKDELLARDADGLEIWMFDTTVGQWRPAVDAQGHPEVLTDFRSPLPSESGPNWTEPQYYKTIQTANLYGNGGQEILARFPDGMRVYKYTPPAGTKDINGGSWSRVSDGGPFSDASGGADPSVYLTIHAVSAQGGLPAMLVAQEQAFKWTGSGWTSIGPTLAPHESDPRYYLDNQVGRLKYFTGPATKPVFHTGTVVFFRTPDGLAAQRYDGSSWVLDGPAPTSGCGGVFELTCSPFADKTSAPGACPHPGTNSCFGDSPSYYETLHFADLSGVGADVVLGRLRDGLHGYRLDSFTPSDGHYAMGWDASLVPTVPGLAGDPATMPAGRWASIRVGDVLGDASDQVLTLDGTSLQAYSLPIGTSTWIKLPASTPLNLGGSLWDTDASYYSTIQVGPVAGPGYPDAVIARGPFGIRTWFYCPGGASRVPGCSSLGGKSGWTGWLPQGTSSYPQFSGGQAAAWAALNTKARADGLIGVSDGSVRAIWTGTNAPTQHQLDDLQNGLLAFAGCSGQPSANPPAYPSCSPPAGTSGFTAADWTAVVNETLAEIYDAGQVVDYFAQLNDLRRDIFLAKGAELPAIADTLANLSGAAGNTADLSPQAIVSAGLGIAGALAGAVAPEIGIPLAIAAYIAGVIPSDTPSLNTAFNGTYAQLQSKFAAAETEADAGLIDQSYVVRQNWGLLALISQLTAPTGPWAKLDEAGLKSAMDEGFALSMYKQLVPTLYTRYVVTGCSEGGRSSCELTGANLGTFGSPPDFTTIGVSPYWGDNSGFHPGTPCDENAVGGPDCDYVALPSEIATTVWGPVKDTCNYNGDPATVWKFGCNLGVNQQASIGLAEGPSNGWNFASYCGHYDISQNSGCGSGSVQLGTNASVTFDAAVQLPRGFQVRSATVPSGGLLFAPGQGSGLGRRKSGQPPLRLTVTTNGKRSSAADSSAQPPDRLALHLSATGTTTMDLGLREIDVSAPAACLQLPASDSLATPPVALRTSLDLSNGKTTRTVSLLSVWRCVRDRQGNITELKTIAPRPLPQRPGLAASIIGPRTVRPAATRIYTVRVRNTRRGHANRAVSSLWHLAVRAILVQPATSSSLAFTPVTRQFGELRRGQTRALRIPIHIPASLRHSSRRRVCVSVLVTADSARPATTRICATIRR